MAGASVTRTSQLALQEQRLK
uniref:Uncharacterized protein n=1 Tax=Anguilla anguilla TaxID=7936 RepID=A0A0E9Q923_ANGAN